MASIIKDPGGRKRLQFIGTDGRRTIHLGKMEQRQADSIRIRVEGLLTALHAGVSPDAETARWLSTLDPKLHAKLAKAGLIESRDTAMATLGTLLDTFFQMLDVKPGTLTTYEQTRRSLLNGFPGNTPLKTITPLAADRWRQGLKTQGLAEATICKRVKVARQVFKQAIRWKMVGENPFAEVKAGNQTNDARKQFVPRDVIDRVMDACPDAEWRLLIALSRYGGLRCPSEHLALKWSDVDWASKQMTVWSSKTEGQGKAFRRVPLFPELEPFLEEAFAQAEEGAVWVITRYRSRECNLRSQLLRIIARAGLEPWPRVWHNLRASRQSELYQHYPLLDVCRWLGNSPAVAAAHYLMPSDRHFKAAVQEPTGPMPRTKATQIPTLHAAELRRTVTQASMSQVA